MSEITRIGLAGDWHGDLGWALRMLNHLHKQDIRLVMHAGDFGVWHDNAGRKFLFRINKLLAELDMHILVTLGNHENYDIVKNFIKVESGEWQGFSISPEHPRILFFQRGQTLTLNGVNFISLGGANSIDRFSRIEHLNWWAGEQISLADMYRTQENALALNGGVDVFLAHDIFSSAKLDLSDGGWSLNAIKYAQKSRDTLQLVAEVVKPRIWVHGHYHQKMVLDTELADVNGERFTIRSYGLDKDNNSDNLAILHLPDLRVEWLDYKVAAQS